MSTVNTYIRDNVKRMDRNYSEQQLPDEKLSFLDKVGNKMEAIASCKIFTSPIDRGYLDKVSKVFNIDEEYCSSIIAIVDTTLRGSFSEGFVFTGTRVFYKSFLEKPMVFVYDEISGAKYEKKMKLDKKGKLKLDYDYIEIYFKNREPFQIKYFALYDGEFFAEFINEIIKYDNFKDENQLQIINDMSNELKIAYVKTIINMAFLNDGKLDSKESAELFFLMDRIELRKENIFDVAMYMSSIDEDNLINSQELVEIIKENCQSSQLKSMMISLIKDIIHIHFTSVKEFKKANLEDIAVLQKNKKLFGLNDSDIEFVFEAVKKDYSILHDNLDDDKIKSLFKDVAARASSVGVPLGALYMSGSVVGFSAPGITSGLAALGMGGLLGFSSMVTGIGVAILIGVGTYQGVRYITGSNKTNKYKQRELMLHEAIKQTQKSINNIIDIINEIVLKFNNSNYNKTLLEKMIFSFTGAAKSMTDKQDLYQNYKNRMRCPEPLDVAKLKNLTNSSEYKLYFDFIMENYKEQETEDDKTQFFLKETIKTETLEEMANIFLSIGYFEISSSLKSKVQEGFSSVTNKIGGSSK
ncbi:MAG: hypothetical protein GX282_03665 [Campylobacteraceae bacterium]|nr:hypothetical protein [Campylobacteraceae bacterium]